MENTGFFKIYDPNDFVAVIICYYKGAKEHIRRLYKRLCTKLRKLVTFLLTLHNYSHRFRLFYKRQTQLLRSSRDVSIHRFDATILLLLRTIG